MGAGNGQGKAMGDRARARQYVWGFAHHTITDYQGWQ
jgi:hypothetical protein